jgi:hypothetical protein
MKSARVDVSVAIPVLLDCILQNKWCAIVAESVTKSGWMMNFWWRSSIKDDSRGFKSRQNTQGDLNDRNTEMDVSGQEMERSGVK